MLKTKRITLSLLMVLAASLTLGTSSCTTAEAAQEPQVYICTGPHSKVYHRERNCKGLKKCSASVKKVPLSSINRPACKICAE